MRVPLAWLRDFVDLPADATAIAERLAMLGFPVDGVETRPSITGVVIGRIARIEKHPNADRLQVAQVDVARERPLTIATAATNVAAGQTIAVATIGARLPHLTIAPRTMRGVASEGMMISAEELALPADWFEDGILQFDPECEPGQDVVALFGLGDAVLDVEITSNRVDAMSMIGIARELAASFGTPLRLPAFHNPGASDEPSGETVSVALESSDCTRFVAQRFDRVAVKAAPAWMRVRLALAGQRPINDVVDVSNYVMLETGQPLHFYDAARIGGQNLIVRDARAGEKLVTLDGVERALSPQALVVAGDGGPLGLAGVMGGAGSEVGDATTAIVLEAATFNGARIRRASKAFGLRTEASSRHEKSLPAALSDAGAARAAQLLCALGATAYRPRVFGDLPAAPVPIVLQPADVERLLGLTLTAERITEHLAALGCKVTPHEPLGLAVTPPSWRTDLTIPADLVEEVARMEGYDRIEAVVPSVPAHAISSAAFDRENAIAHTLAALGYREIITHSLHGREPLDAAASTGLTFDAVPVEVLNPLSEDQRYLRASLADGLIAYFANADEPVAVFEIGHVFSLRGESVVERPALTFGFSAEPVEDEPAWRDAHFLRLKGDCETLLAALAGRRSEAARGEAAGLHPGKTATLAIDGRKVATLGRLDPRLGKAFEVRLPAYLCSVDLDALPEYALPHYRPPSRFPGTYRDLALVVDLETNSSAVERAISQTLGELVTSVRVFDEYRGLQVPAGRKSLAVRVWLQRFDATITDEEADVAIARALKTLQAELGAAIRA
jgi:phenylalanyl-tRNA synthetase beta chain